MDCEQALTLISANNDRETQADEKAQLDAHLRECAACRVTAEAFRLQDADLRQTFAARRQAAAVTGDRVVAQMEDTPSPALNRRPVASGRRLAFALAAAAALLALSFYLQGIWHKTKPNNRQPDDLSGVERLTPRPRLAAPAPKVLAVNDSIETKRGERRRVLLPDGSVLFVNQNSAVKLDNERHLSLSEGEVYVEVAPRQQSDAQATFVVETAKHKISALGTKFAVRSDGERNGVLVAQGKLKVDSGDTLVKSGQQMLFSAEQPVAAPRLSAALDWTKDLLIESETPLVPGSQFDGGALIAVDANGQESKLALRKYHIDVYVEDGFARTTIDQTYFNDATFRMEGTFYFPLPPDASLSRLAVYVDGTLMEGGMAERDYARQVYENIVRSQRDPALLEWVDGSTFKMRVFPLEARQEKRIVLSYTQRLPSLYGRTSYRFPAGHSLDVVHEWGFHALVKNGANMSWTSDTHALKEKRDGADLLLDAVAEDIKVDQDVALELRDIPVLISDKSAPEPYPSGDGTDVPRFSLAEHEGSKYLMLRYRPMLAVKAERQRRDWVFLFESSGDRDPLLARTQIEVIRALLTNAEHDDTFVLLTAGTRVHAFRPGPVQATSSNVREALAFLDQSHLVGALDLGNALNEAEPYLVTARNPWLVHVGTGLPGMGEHREKELIQRIPAGTRYVGVGVGKHWSRSLMKNAAERTGGYFTQINPDEPVAWRGFELSATLNTPRLLDVNVIDSSEKAVFLNYTSSVAQGEELCAIARIDAKMPKSLTITGTLDGQPFSREVIVENIAEHADYLPRTWAKLEIDRLLADDPSKNKDRIVELSKAMYVMTPFTSLLVLENEEMYKQFKVDRGRKDHWAMYPCEAKIPVVYDPLPGMPLDRFAPKTEKPRENEILQTILVRVPPRFVMGPSEQYGAYGPVVTAVMIYTGAFAVSDPMDGMRVIEHETWEETNGDLPVLLGDGSVRELGEFRLAELGGAKEKKRQMLLPALSSVSYRERELGNTFGFYPPATGLVVSGKSRIYDRKDAGKKEMPPTHYRTVMVGGKKQVVPYTVTKAVVSHTEFDKKLKKNQKQIVDKIGNLSPGGRWRPGYLSAGEADPDQVLGSDWGGSPIGFQDGTSNTIFLGARRADLDSRTPIFSPIRTQLLSRSGASKDGLSRGWGWDGDDATPRELNPPMYSRPHFTGDDRLFYDLISYAPGMNTSAADIQAVLESEAAPNLASLPGRIDPAARQLIDKSRTAGWRTLKLGDVNFTFDTSGRYAYERTLPLGLRERVVCDGQALLHLYPELAIGAKRTVSRFHRAEISGLVPWVLPPADDLAHGADVTSVDAHTVALSSRGADKAKDAEGNPVPYLRVLLLFADDGRLAQRRLVEMPESKLLLRESYETDAVKVFDADGKELATRKVELSDAKDPELHPDTSALVVLPLPLRSRQHVYASFDLDPNRQVAAEWLFWNARHDPEAILKLFAAEIASRNGPQARMIFHFAYKAQGIHKLGFYTLLASVGENISNDLDLTAGRERDPLAQYLAIRTNPIYRILQRRFPLDLGTDFAPGDSFLGGLAGTHDRLLAQNGPRSNRDPKFLQAQLGRSLEFVHQHKKSVLGLALLLNVVGRAENYEAPQAAIADAWDLFADQPGTHYFARYQKALALRRGGRRADARKVFSDLYEETLKKGALPPIDNNFRSALESNGNDADEWTDLIRKTGDKLSADNHRSATVVLAWQCWQLGDQPLAHELLTRALDGFNDDDERLPVKLTAIQYLFQTNQFAQADSLLQGLLDNDAFAKFPELWRIGVQIADRRAMNDKAIARLERALDLEYHELPEVIDLQPIRDDYGRLLRHYQSLAQSARTLKTNPPADLLAKTIRIADRWRALDRDGNACTPAADVLQLLNATDLAWEYETTPLASQEKNAGPWVNLAVVHNREGEFTLADRAYATAFETQPDNPHLLWDRAQNLRQAGRNEEAKKLLRQIADGDWKSDFLWMKSQTRRQAEE
jgi:ferric-dicitrate binding protein FerR (iron transport regulator)/tetratricopeptide (TPR) repeat protein